MNGQNQIRIAGLVSDSNQVALTGATTVLLHAGDSVLAYFAVTDKKGQFTISNVKPAKYIFQVSFLGYSNYSDLLAIAGDKKEIDLGTIYLQEEVKSLNEVVITGEASPITIKKDTIEYNAASFKTKENAVVEELLEQLPGVEVDEDGSVKAQGKTVEKVLVDGKEFFGEDPKIATKNLPAEAVDKVQVYDKKSDMAEFTGIDDGTRQKTINLALKEDHKKGSFGKITAGYGSEDRYELKSNYNNFFKDTRLSIIASSNNVNQQSFSINDYIAMKGGIGSFVGGQGKIEINIGGEGHAPFSQDLSAGFVNTTSVGANLSQEFSKNTNLNFSYFGNFLKHDLESMIQRENFLPGKNLFYTDFTNSQLNKNSNHRFNVVFEHKIDSSQNIKLRAGFSTSSSDLASTNNNLTLDELYNPENTSDQDYQSDGNGKRGDAQLTYRKKLGKTGRNFSINTNGGLNNQEALMDLWAINQYFSGNINPVIDSIIQDQSQTNDQLSYSAKVSYTEPLGRRQYLEFNLQQSNYKSDINREVIDLYPFELFNEHLSNHYKRYYSYQQAGMNYRFNRNKYSLTLGGMYQNSLLRGNLQEEGQEIKRSFQNILPSLRAKYDISNSANLRLDYETSVREPSLEQLQPIVDNTDPLNIYVGNPDLRPEYHHSITTHFFSFSQFSYINVFGYLQGTLINNPIANGKTIDSLFRQTIRPVNSERAYRFTGNLSFGAPLKFIKSRFNISTNVVYLQSIAPINGLENLTDTWIQSARLRIDNRNKDILNLGLTARVSRNQVSYELDPNLNRTYYNQSYSGRVGLTFLKNLFWNNSFSYSIYDGVATGVTQKIPILSSSLSWYLADRRIELKFGVVDLLNRNTGISQSSSLNYLEYKETNNLGRYFLLSMTYSLKKFGNKDPGIVIERL